MVGKIMFVSSKKSTPLKMLIREKFKCMLKLSSMVHVHALRLSNAWIRGLSSRNIEDVK